MAEAHGKFVWYELMTPDIGNATAFYGDVVGWSAKDVGAPEMAYTIFEIPGYPMGVAGMMELTAAHRATGIPPSWTGYIAVDDVDLAAADVVTRGGAIRRQPEDVPGIGRFAVAADPHGAVFSLFRPMPPEEMPDEPAEGTPGTVGWHELFAGNLDEAFDFYGAVFGWTRDEAVDMEPMGVYQLFAHEGKAIGGMMTKPPDVPAPYWTYYFNVEALDAAVDRVAVGGGRIVNGPMEVPGGAWIAQGFDPQDAFFSLVSMKR